MRKKALLLLVMLIFLLSACTGAEQVAVETEVVSGSAETESTAADEFEKESAEKAEQEPRPVDATSTPEASSDVSQPAANEFVSECTLVSSLPDPPAEYAELFAVTADDWIKGPEDAAITLVVYGDFQ